MADDRVVITGAGIVCSLGNSIADVWGALLAGKQGIGPVQGFDASGFPCRVAAQVRDLDAQALGINPRDARTMDTHSYMLMKCARDAFSGSGLDNAGIAREEIGFFGGMGMVDYRMEDLFPAVVKSMDSEGHLDYDAFYAHGYEEIYPLWPLSMLNNVTFCQVAIALNIQGDNTVFSPHADSGLQAVVEGMNSLLHGKSRAVLAGGVSEKVSPCSLARAHLSGILNTSVAQYEKPCRPFDSERSGTALGEGCGVVALELESSARQRTVEGLAAITGYGIAFESDGRSVSPTAGAFSSAMEGALARAQVKPSDIDVIIAHGDGTLHGDTTEMEAIDAVFPGSVDRPAVFSSKAALGHLLAGAPLVDLVLGIEMLRNGTVPATINTSSQDIRARFRVVTDKPLTTSVRRIMINCQSYEGQAGTLILERVEE